MQNKRTSNATMLFAMILVDVLIKIVIDNLFMGKKFLINDRIGFLPFLNTEQLSILNNEFGMEIDLMYLIAINIIGFFVLMWVRSRLKKEKEWSTGLDIGTIMILAGVICSLIDKLFWKGSLDYILFFSKIVDLKDIYMFIGLFVCIIDLGRQGVGLVRTYLNKW